MAVPRPRYQFQPPVNANRHSFQHRHPVDGTFDPRVHMRPDGYPNPDGQLLFLALDPAPQIPGQPAPKVARGLDGRQLGELPKSYSGFFN